MLQRASPTAVVASPVPPATTIIRQPPRLAPWLPREVLSRAENDAKDFEDSRIPTFGYAWSFTASAHAFPSPTPVGHLERERPDFRRQTLFVVVDGCEWTILHRELIGAVSRCTAATGTRGIARCGSGYPGRTARPVDPVSQDLIRRRSADAAISHPPGSVHGVSPDRNRSTGGRDPRGSSSNGR